MKSRIKYEVRAVIIFLIFMLAVISSHAAQDSIGYLVVENTYQEVKVIKTLEMDAVRDIVKKHKVDADVLLDGNMFFELRTTTGSVYVEKKRAIIRNGKLKYKRL